jgi:anti-sigma factor RsiW
MDSDVHHRVQGLLPWFASGRLEPAEANDVEAHLAGCAACRADLEWERQLCAAQAEGLVGGDADVESDVEPGWARLRTRIASADPVPPRVAPAPSVAASAAGRSILPWWGWVLAAQFAAIVTLGAMLTSPPPPVPTYRALGLPERPTTANIVVRFRPDAIERDLRRGLEAAGARVVDGPTVTGAYLIKVVPGREAAALARLRGDPAVLLAESLDAGARP